MSTIKTDTDKLFLDSLESSGLKLRHTEASDFLREQGLPGLKNEEYKHSPVTKLLKGELEKTYSSASTSVKGFESPLKEDHITLTFVNGHLQEIPGGLPEGLSLSTSDRPSLLIDHQSAGDAFQKINEAYFTDVLRIKVARGMDIGPLVHIVQYIDASEENILCVPRIEIELEEQATLGVVEHITYRGDHSVLAFPAVVARVGKNARLTTYTLQMDGREQIAVRNQLVSQARDSFYKNVTISTSGKFVRNNHNVVQTGENCESHLYGLTLTRGRDHIDHHTIVDHTMPNSFSNELYKGIMDESSTGVFNGRIYVRPNAQQTNAYQSNNNILLTDDATIHTKPQLEIWADDVKCTHGCTSGQLDEEALFYLRTRGMNERQARGMLLRAFAGEVIENVGLDSIREYISDHVGERLG